MHQMLGELADITADRMCEPEAGNEDDGALQRLEQRDRAQPAALSRAMRPPARRAPRR